MSAQWPPESEGVIRLPVFAPPQIEAAACAWCRHLQKKKELDKKRNLIRTVCLSPRVSPARLRTWTSDTNLDGRCKAYEPSLAAQIARLFGRRKPWMIPAEPE